MLHPLNRRRFLQTSILASLGTTLYGAAALLPAHGMFQWPAAGAQRSLTPFFLAQDLLRLVHLSELDKSVRQALTVNSEHFQIGKAWSVASDEIIKVFQDSQSHWRDEAQDDRIFTQFALVSGWLAHRVFEKWLPGHLPTENDAGQTDLPEQFIYQDTYVIKMLNNADPRRKKLPLDQPLSGVKPEDMAQLFHLIQQRNLIRMHTIRPEFSDIETWLDQFLNYYRQLKEDNHRYAQVYCQPDQEKINQYISQPNFYDEKDAIIGAARDLGRNRIAGKKAVRKIEPAEKPKSVYGQALQEAEQRLQVGGLFILGKASVGELQKAVTI